MSLLTGKLDIWFEDLTQDKSANAAKGVLQNARTNIQNADNELQRIKEKTGNFDQLDAEIKFAFMAAWNVIKTAKTAFENETIAELLDWSP